MDFLSHALFVVSLICLHLNRITLAGEDVCLEKLSMETKQNLMATLETCKKKVGLDEIPKPEEVEKNGFDDKCFAKCKLQELKLLTDKGAIDPKAVEEMLEKVVPDKKMEVGNIWKECAEKLKKALEPEGGVTEKNDCKAAAMLKHCIVKDVMKFCK